MIIPIRYIYDRKSQESAALLGNANRVMNILERIMNNRKLDQYSITMEPYDGALIKCSKRFGKREIEIQTGLIKPPEQIVVRKCLCNCNFTIGWILEVKDGVVDGNANMYDVMVCQEKNHYVQFNDVLANDFVIYEVEQPIVAIPYNQMTYSCCSNITLPTGCSSLVSENLITEDEWRSTIRIISLCGLGLPMWIYENG